MRAGAPVLMDDLAGSGFRVVVKDRQLAAALCVDVLVARIDARIVLLGTDVDVDTDVAAVGVLCIKESDGVLARWFSRHACVAAIVRPDHYVYGVAAGAEQLDAQLSLLDAAMK